MYKSDFNFDLPEDLIAQTPLESREQSRLLCMDRISGGLMHHRFYELPGLLRKGDCLVLNDSRVLPARLLGVRESGGVVEVLLLRETQEAKEPSPCFFPQEAKEPSPCFEVLLLRETQEAKEPSPCFFPQETQEAQEPSPCFPQEPQEAEEPSPCFPQEAEEPSPCFLQEAKEPSPCFPTATWECLVYPGKKIKTGTKLFFGDGELTGTVNDIINDGNRVIEFSCEGIFLEVLEKLGKMPLPPYIHEELNDAERYQTVYSREVGSAAAPTAGLHMTKDLLEELITRGIEICYITLHVGLGTFRPVKAERIDDHKMHAEYFTITEKTVETVNRIKSGGGRVIAVGTTSCRALETIADDTGRIRAFSGNTDIFIYPGYDFKCIDGLITNFHLPESTLIMLVSAFAGREKTLHAYEEAIRRKYRFFSFGDAMLIS